MTRHELNGERQQIDLLLCASPSHQNDGSIQSKTLPIMSFMVNSEVECWLHVLDS